MSLNVYHLEIFFHVAKHSSISKAAESLRREQPTISALVGDLEKSLGDVRLFHRRPFRLTDPGQELFEAIQPFFTNLPKIEEKIRGGDVIRIGASPIILRDHLPSIVKQVRKQFPDLRLFLREGNQAQLLRDVECDEIDIAIALMPEQVPPKVKADLLDLALMPVLLVPTIHKAKTAKEILEADATPPLIALPPNELLTQLFMDRLKDIDLIWRPSIEVTSLELIQHYVLQGYGVGLSVHIPDAALPSSLRELPLVDFSKVELALLYRDHGSMPLFQSFVAEAKKHSARLRTKIG